MRRPRKTKAQRAYERTLRRLRVLQRACVRMYEDESQNSEADEYVMRVTELVAAAQRWAASLSTADRRRLAK